jgi:hypothetical protein
VWGGKDQQEAFEALKQAISQRSVLRMADFSKKFILQTDASGVALGAVLSQDSDGVRQPTAYASRTLSAQERKASSIYELECLAMLCATEKFRKYIEHQEFILETDNQALSCLLSHPRQLRKIGRWVVKISALKFQVRHIRGKQNNVVDTLSRMFDSSSPDVPNQVSCNLALTAFSLVFLELGQLQKQDSVLADIIAKLERGDKVDNYSLSKGTLYRRSCNGRGQKLVVPAAAIPMVFA